VAAWFTNAPTSKTSANNSILPDSTLEKSSTSSINDSRWVPAWLIFLQVGDELVLPEVLRFLDQHPFLSAVRSSTLASRSRLRDSSASCPTQRGDVLSDAGDGDRLVSLEQPGQQPIDLFRGRGSQGHQSVAILLGLPHLIFVFGGELVQHGPQFDADGIELRHHPLCLSFLGQHQQLLLDGLPGALGKLPALVPSLLKLVEQCLVVDQLAQLGVGRIENCRRRFKLLSEPLHLGRVGSSENRIASMVPLARQIAAIRSSLVSTVGVATSVMRLSVLLIEPM
jgi:hypothetical protein